MNAKNYWTLFREVSLIIGIFILVVAIPTALAALLLRLLVVLFLE